MRKKEAERIAAATQHVCGLISKWTIGIKYSGCDTKAEANFHRRHFCNTKVRNLTSNLRDMNDEILNGNIAEAIEWADCLINIPIPEREEYDPENQDGWENPEQ